jgi:hypothetical protein
MIVPANFGKDPANGAPVGGRGGHLVSNWVHMWEHVFQNYTLFETLLGQYVPLFTQFSPQNSEKYPFQNHCFQNPPLLAIFDEFIYPKPVTRVTRSLAKLFLLDFAVAHSYPLRSHLTPRDGANHLTPRDGANMYALAHRAGAVVLCSLWATRVAHAKFGDSIYV